MRKKKYNIHPDFKPLSLIKVPMNSKTIRILQKGMRISCFLPRSNGKVKVERIHIESESGNTVKALLFTPKRLKTKGCLLYLHGGGFAFPAAWHQYRMARIYAEIIGCRVLFPDYRLAPDHPFPAAPKDSFAAYLYLRSHFPDSPIVVCGDSAGGTLSMVVCLMAHDHQIPGPCAQLLLYPYVGECGETRSMQLYKDAPLLTRQDMDQYIAWYLQDPDAGKHAYWSPVDADSYEAFPMTYIETAEYDGLRDGAILYAKKLHEMGIRVALYNTKGTIHGFDMIQSSRIVKKLLAKRIRFLKKAFSESNPLPEPTT